MKTLLIDIARDLADIAMCGDPQPDHERSSVSQDALTSIRGRAANLQARVSALLELAKGASPGTLAEWTDAHRQLFGQWCRTNYPNEACAGMIALGDAWMDGLLVGASVALVATDSVPGDATPGTTPADLIDAPGARRDDDAAQAADAERYRFIKAKAEQCDTGWIRYWRLRTIDMPIDQPRATLDEAIDAAWATQQPQKLESPTCQSGEDRAPRADDRDYRAGYGACTKDR